MKKILFVLFVGVTAFGTQAMAHNNRCGGYHEKINPSLGPNSTVPKECCRDLEPVPLPGYGAGAVCYRFATEKECEKIANDIMPPGMINKAHPWQATPLTDRQNEQEPYCKFKYPDLFLPRP